MPYRRARLRADVRVGSIETCWAGRFLDGAADCGCWTGAGVCSCKTLETSCRTTGLGDRGVCSLEADCSAVAGAAGASWTVGASATAATAS